MDQTTNLVSQVKDDYLAYSMAVLVGRAIPDLYDGLKPVQRRVLQTMLEEGLHPDKRYVKCARVTGLTMAYYHPHGGAYGALVNMSTAWNNNVPWVDGHGNFGSTTDNPAAERYTECRLRESAVNLLLQDPKQWETTENYDGSRQEAIRFNSAAPSVLLNGDSGIAVGFATKLAPHNLRELTQAVKLGCKFNWTEKERIKSESEALKHLTPDFPTGCNIINDEGLDSYIRTGIGSIRLRAILETTTQKATRGKEKAVLTFTNLPPGTNPEKLGEQIKDALEKGKIDGISEIIDESDLGGDRLTIIAKPGVEPGRLSQQLYAFTDLDTKYSARTLVIDGLKPVELSPLEVCQKWFRWRMDVLERVYRAEHEAAEERLEIVTGLLKAIGKIDAVIKVIRAAASPKEALIELVSNKALKFTSLQAKAILEMRLRQLTNLDGTELEAEKESLEERLEDLWDLISEPTSRAIRIYKQLTELATRHGEKRKCEVIAVPESLVTEKGTARVAQPSKPKFVKIDMKRGVVEQVKGPRGAIILEKTDKLITVTENGTIKKLAPNYKGPLSDGYSGVVLAKKENDVAERRYLVVFTLETALKAMVVTGADLAKVTSKGKRLLPDGATLIHFGEGTYTVTWASSRKKPVILDLSVKAGKPGGKGIKVGALTDIRGVG